MERVKFYSANDWSCGFYLGKAQIVIEKHAKGITTQNISDIIELYNVRKFFDNKIHLTTWTKKDIDYYEDITNSFIEIIANHFNALTDDSFIPTFRNVDRKYREDFWELVDKYKVYENISSANMSDILKEFPQVLQHILQYKKLTNHFGSVIRDTMLSCSGSATLLLDEYEMKHISARKQLYFPKDLTVSDKEQILCNYIDSENPNLNYLSLIKNIQSNKDKLKASPQTLLKAKKREETEIEKCFNEHTGVKVETTVAFLHLQGDEVILCEKKGLSLKLSYDITWIEENVDFATLLNNFIYMFGFVDKQMRWVLVNKKNRMSVSERYLATHSKNSYIKGIEFEHLNTVTYSQIVGYHQQLLRLGIRLEDLIEWLFRSYLPDEFGVPSFEISMPSSGSTVLEKCSNIMPAMEHALKQFSLFIQEGYIDLELLDIRPSAIIYENIPSQIEKKYVYGIGEEFNNATYFLFSDQSTLGYSEKSKHSYENLVNLLINEKLALSDYPEYEISCINWLIEHDFLTIDQNGFVIFASEDLIYILNDLYYNEVISYWRCSNRRKSILDELGNRNVVEFKSTLFSKPEQDFINYTLNNSKFNDSLALRNKYTHSQPSGSKEIHLQNYMYFLRIALLFILKINDDFCINENIRKMDNSAERET